MTDLPVFSNACVAKKSQAVTGILFNSCKNQGVTALFLQVQNLCTLTVKITVSILKYISGQFQQTTNW